MCRFLAFLIVKKGNKMSVMHESNPQELEEYKLGDIVDIKESSFNKFDITLELQPKATYEVTIKDPYVELFSDQEKQEVNSKEIFISSFAEQRRLKGYWSRGIGKAYIDENEVQQERKHESGDPVSSNILFNKLISSTALNVWRKIIPSAISLMYVSGPFAKQDITDKKGNAVYIDETARKWWSLNKDCIAIRARGTLLSYLVNDFIEKKMFTQEGRLPNLVQMSVACGTALPVMQSVLKVDIESKLILVDKDKKALSATETLASEIGYSGQIFKYDETNIFSTDEMESLSNELDDKNLRPMIIDLMGIFEYTGNNIGVDPVNFLKSNYDMLQEDGRLIFGQMLSSRPLKDFMMGAVGWPYVETRNPEEVLGIIREAGIPLDSVKIYFPDDGIYMVVVIDK